MTLTSTAAAGVLRVLLQSACEGWAAWHAATAPHRLQPCRPRARRLMQLHPRRGALPSLLLPLAVATAAAPPLRVSCGRCELCAWLPRHATQRAALRFQRTTPKAPLLAAFPETPCRGSQRPLLQQQQLLQMRLPPLRALPAPSAGGLCASHPCRIAAAWEGSADCSHSMAAPALLQGARSSRAVPVPSPRQGARAPSAWAGLRRALAHSPSAAVFEERLPGVGALAGWPVSRRRVLLLLLLPQMR